MRSDIELIYEAYQNLILEMGPNVTLYHRSMRDHQPGAVLEHSTRPETSIWRVSPEERAIEKYREERHSDKIPRNEAIYCSAVPRSAFIGKGKLYRVRPVGKVHITDSRLINYISERSGDYNLPPIRNDYDTAEAYKRAYAIWLDRATEIVYYNAFNYIATYWNGIVPNRDNIKFVEFLCGKVTIIEEIVEQEAFRPGDRVRFKVETKADYYGYTSDPKGDKPWPPKAPDEYIEKVKAAFPYPKDTPDYIRSTSVVIPAGTTGTLKSVIRRNIHPNETHEGEQYMQVYFEPDGYNAVFDLRFSVGGYSKPRKLSDLLEKI